MRRKKWGFDDRKSRRVTAMLHKRGIIVEPTHRAPFRIAFPACSRAWTDVRSLSETAEGVVSPNWSAN